MHNDRRAQTMRSRSKDPEALYRPRTRRVRWKRWVVIVVALVVVYLWLGRGKAVDKRSPANEFLRDQSKKVSESNLQSKMDSPFVVGCVEPAVDQPRASAAFVMLARNKEVDEVVRSMESLERHFNQWFGYPWVFLNDEPFSEEFKTKVAKHTTAQVEFGTIGSAQWDFPPEVQTPEYHEYIQAQGDRRIMYGNLESYHKMCRFYLGQFFHHELVKKRDWYWRVEPGVEFFCDLTYDPFIEMERHGKKYGFTVMIHDLYYTIPGLFRETRAFIRKHNIKVKDTWNIFIHDSKTTKGDTHYDTKGKRNILGRIQANVYLRKLLGTRKKSNQYLSKLAPDVLSDIFDRATDKPTLYEDRMDREEYNLCHFWSNFEIARTDIFTSDTYTKYFQHLDESGGFWKERWGDAPVHTLGVAMMLDKSEIHYFRDIGYRHADLGHCPYNAPEQKAYVPADERYPPTSGLWLVFIAPDTPQANGVGCRCRCGSLAKIEDSKSSCIKTWARHTSDSHRDLQPVDTNVWQSRIERRIEQHLFQGGAIGDDILDSLLEG